MKLSFIPDPLKHQQLRRLISNGYFPSELPPPFVSTLFGKHSVELAARWPGAKMDGYWTKPERYSMPRFGLARRQLSIVNPVNQLRLSHIISENWDQLREHLKKSSITEFKPEIVLSGEGRAITGVDFDGVSRRKAKILGSYGRYVKTDVARFYASIYTHSIAWALEGKIYAKENHNSVIFKNSLGNQIDKAVRAGQEGQTIGIPIGPDTSRIIAELIAVEVEIIAQGLIPDLVSRTVRYVDDIIIGLDENQTPSAALAGLSGALYEYELELNAEKTLTHGIGCLHSPEWINYIRTFKISPRKNQQRVEIDSYFEQALYLADSNPRENVMLFAVKSAMGLPIDPENTGHLVSWLLYASRRAPSCLSFVAQRLAVMATTHDLPKDQISNFIIQQIPIKAEAGHTDEVAWLLFWAREIELQIPSSALANVVRLRSSVVALIILDLRDRKLIAGEVDTKFWQGFATEEGLKSEMWLVVYEASKKDWWHLGANAYPHIIDHQFFGDLWNLDVSFYDPSRKASLKTGREFTVGPSGPEVGGVITGYPFK